MRGTVYVSELLRHLVLHCARVLHPTTDARLVGAGGRGRTGTALSSRGIFLPTTALAAGPSARSRFRLVCGLDYTFTLARSRVRCCPSSLYTFAPVVRPERLARDCLLPVSPNLSSSAPSVSRRALKRLSPLRLPISPRPLWLPDQILSAFSRGWEIAPSWLATRPFL